MSVECLFSIAPLPGPGPPLGPNPPPPRNPGVSSTGALHAGASSSCGGAYVPASSISACPSGLDGSGTSSRAGVQLKSGASEHKNQELSYVGREGEDEGEEKDYRGTSTGWLRSRRAAWRCGTLDGP